MRTVVILALGVFGFVSNVMGAVIGEKVGFERGKKFHVEFRVIKNSTEVEKMRNTRVNGQNPVSFMYGVSRNAKDGITGFEFANCGLRADVAISDVINAGTLAGKDLDVVDKMNVKVGVVRPSKAEGTTVEFKDLDLRDGRLAIVLPFGFGPNPTLTVSPKNWTAVTTSPQGFSHRTEKSKGVNVGFIPDTVVDVTKSFGTCTP